MARLYTPMSASYDNELSNYILRRALEKRYNNVLANKFLLINTFPV